MAELLDDNEQKKKDLYRKMLAEEATAESTRKYSFPKFKERLSGDEVLLDKVSDIAVKKGWSSTKDDFYGTYFPELFTPQAPPTPKPQAAPAQQFPVGIAAPTSIKGAAPSVTDIGREMAFEPAVQQPIEPVEPVGVMAPEPAQKPIPSVTEVAREMAFKPPVQPQMPEEEEEMSLGQKTGQTATELISGFNRALLKTPSSIVKTASELGVGVLNMLGGNMESEDAILYNLADKYDKWLDTSETARKFVGSPEYTGLAANVGSGLGQVFSMIAAGPQSASKALLSTPGVLKAVSQKMFSKPSLIAFSQVFNSEFENMKAKGESEQTAFNQGLANAMATAPLENLPLINLAERLNKTIGVKLARRVLNAIQQGVEEGGQEAVQQIFSNLTNNQLVESEENIVDWAQGIQPSAEAGGVVGLLIGGLANAKAARKYSKKPAAAPESEAIPAEEVQDAGYRTVYAKTREEIPVEYRNNVAEIERATTPLGRFGPMEKVFAYRVPTETIDITPQAPTEVTPEPAVTETAPVAEEIPFEEATPVTEEATVAPLTEEELAQIEETELTPEEEAALLPQEETAPAPAEEVAPAEEEVATEVVPETQKAQIEKKSKDLEKRYNNLKKRHKKELSDLNKKEGKNYEDTFDILNINEYSRDKTPRSKEAIELANRHEKEFQELLQEQRSLQDMAGEISYSSYDFSGKKPILQKLKEAIGAVYRRDKNALDEGFMNSYEALNRANQVGGGNYVAHGMGKASIPQAYNALVELFTKGINPQRGGGRLYVAPLSGGISMGQTASGNAYMDGPFTLVANREHQGDITDINQVGGIIVNDGIATDDVISSLRDLFPNLIIESTSNTDKLVEQLNQKAEQQAAPVEEVAPEAPAAPAPKGRKKAAAPKAKPAPVAEKEEGKKPAPKEGKGKVATKVEEYEGVFNPNKTGVAGIDELLTDDGYQFFYKGKKVERVLMSPNEYLERVRKGLKTKTDANILEGKTDAIKKAIESGAKINAPFISTVGGKFSQEGRNRAVVARELGEQKIPVFIESDVTFDDKINRGAELVKQSQDKGNKTKEEVLEDIKKSGLHRDGVRFIEENYDAIQGEAELAPIAEKEEGKKPAPKTTQKKYEKGKEEGGLTLNETPGGVPYLSQSGGADYEVPSGLQWEGDRLNGEFLSVIGKWNETNYISFTGDTYVKDASDVAEIMSLLENKSVEHSFAVHVDEDGKGHVQFLNIGVLTETHMNKQAIIAGVKRFKTKKLYLVHNHPSGQLKISDADKAITETIQQILAPLKVIVDHVILNTYKKQYSVYENWGGGKYIEARGIARKEEGGKEKLTTHIFNEQQVLSKPQKSITTPLDAAEFIQQMRLTALPKSAMLLLNTNNEIIGNYFFVKGIDYNEILDIISTSGIARSIVFYGNQNNVAEINKVSSLLKDAYINVLDAITLSSNGESVVRYYESAAEKGVLKEVHEKYGTNSVPLPSPSFTSQQSSEAATAFDKAKTSKGFDKKYGKGAYKALSDITKNFDAIMDKVSDKIKQDCL